MDQFSRRIVGFAAHRGNMDGPGITYMFNKIISGKSPLKYLSTDHDPLFRFHRWRANLRIHDIEEIKTIPYTPLSHPFVERLIKSVRSELLDRTLVWNKIDLEHKLEKYKHYFNQKRSHMSLKSETPHQQSQTDNSKPIDICNYHWQSLCRGLFQLPVIA